MKIRSSYLLLSLQYITLFLNINASQPAPMAIDSSESTQANLAILNPSGTPEGWQNVALFVKGINDKLRKAPKDMLPDAHAIHRQNLAQHAYDKRQDAIRERRNQTNQEIKQQKESSEHRNSIFASAPAFIPYDIVPFDKEKHFDSVKTLFQETFPYSATCIDIATAVQLMSYDILLYNNNFAGYIAYSADLEGATHGQIWWLAIEEKLRARGFGTILLRHALAKLKRKNVKTVIVAPGVKSIGFYCKNGFQTDGSSEFYNITL